MPTDKSLKFLFSLIWAILVSLLVSPLVLAQNTKDQSETMEAKVIQVLEEKLIMPEYGDKEQLYQMLRLSVTKGSFAGQDIIVENGNIPAVNLPKYQKGDLVVVNNSKDYQGQDYFVITDYVRRDSLLWLFLIFVVITVAIGRFRGFASLVGMGISFAIIFKFILPQISNGANPIFIAIVASLFIIPITFFLSHGVNKKTLVAVISTLVSLIITGILAGFFVAFSKLTGFASEEAGFLQTIKGGSINIQGLLLAGIIISALGVLDDITVSQSSIVFQLKEVNPDLKFPEVFRRAMSIGQDHISSMVNTLVLVYAGAALPLLLLFVDNPRPFSEIVNYEIIADEILRTLVGSIGLVLAVPITTLLAAHITTGKKLPVRSHNGAVRQ